MNEIAACHICHMPMAGPGRDFCSYPHGMVPDKAVNADRPEGFWTWKLPNGDGMTTENEKTT